MNKKAHQLLLLRKYNKTQVNMLLNISMLFLFIYFLFSSDKWFIYFISDVPHDIRSNQNNTVCTILVKVDVLDTCGALICSYFGIAFVLFLWRYKILFTHLSLIFDIMNIQNNQSLEFEWIPILPPLRSVNERRFSWLRNVFFWSFQCQGNFTKDAA